MEHIQAADVIEARRTALAAAIVDRRPSCNSENGPRSGRDDRIREQELLLQYLAEALRAGIPELFVNYTEWLRTRFDSLGLHDGALTTALSCSREVLAELLPDDTFSSVDVCLAAAAAHLSERCAVSDRMLRPESPLGGLAAEYLARLLEGDRRGAGRCIMAAVDRGVPVKEVYLGVFQTAQYEIGRLWQINRISVAQEHFCTAATQMIMSQLYPRIFSERRIGRCLVATCVGGELHEIGIRMVADFFEMDGWDTYYLGANTPAESVLDAVRRQAADVLGISATMAFHVTPVAHLIAAVREALGDGVKILVGGYPFRLAPELWTVVGADGFASGADTAVSAAERLLAV